MSVLDRLTVAVTFDPAKGYVATIPNVAAPVTALSLNGLRRRIEALLLPDSVVVRLLLDRDARLERDARRKGGPGQQSHARVRQVAQCAGEGGRDRAAARAGRCAQL